MEHVKQGMVQLSKFEQFKDQDLDKLLYNITLMAERTKLTNQKFLPNKIPKSTNLIKNSRLSYGIK